ncbi:hypothetical protein SDC9_153360 [bioreactor metagenome]|uniref:Uncharacterized protein n=1 Tax=bioreactor metagenome TaxID=1076179 RepID=A0A645EVQ1_9ZZZZ
MDNKQVMCHSLLTSKSELFEYMIIRTADKDACLFYANIFYKLKVILVRSDPCCYLRKFISEFHTFFKRFTVFFAVNKKFCLFDKSVGSAEPVKHVVYFNNLFY